MKFHLLAGLTALLLLCGCGKTQESEGAAPERDTAVLELSLSATPAPEAQDEAARYGVYSLDGGEETDEFGNYDSDTGDENALLAQDGAALTIRNADVNKTGDGAHDMLSGLNAAAAAAGGASLRLESCTVTTNGLGAIGLFASGEGSLIGALDAQVVTAGGNSPALALTHGAAAEIESSRLMSEAADAPLIAAAGGASVTLRGCTLQFSGAEAVRVADGELALTLDAQQLTGDIALAASEGGAAGLRLTLQNGAAFTGALLSGSADSVHVSLDETSQWTLTAEITLSSLSAPDTDFAGIQSNGFNIYYNAELETNAWLGSQAYMLPGGGFLSPRI
ncbi:MAG: hypothetical protein Q4C13_06375 [Clostridia bacterium]|nr:hypothetical protein [Clostridia bacterium]